MAIETRFKCNKADSNYLKVKAYPEEEEVGIFLELDGVKTQVYLDIPTSIKLSKTIRTAINLIKKI